MTQSHPTDIPTPIPVLVTEATADEGQYITRALGDAYQVKTVSGPLAEVSPEELSKVVVLLPFIHSLVGRVELAAMPHLRLIATRSTGYDHVDLAGATEHGVTVANVPGYGENAVAEHTFALILILTRKLNLAYIRTQQGNYTLEGLRGIDLYGKTLGVVGAGAIGLHVIRIAKGFGMQVIAYDVRQDRNLSEALGFHYVNLEELFSHADIITLHAPAIPSTYHMVNRESLSLMKRGTYLINTSRGSLVDIGALEWALETGILAGVGLDTLEGEEFLQREEELLNEPGTEEKLKLLVHHHILQRRGNVVITPHIAFNTEEALRRIQDTTVENVHAFVHGKPQNVMKLA